MMQIGIVGVAAGAAAALLFATIASGSILAAFLFYLAPLPILIAALGWTHWAGLVAAFAAAASLSMAFSFYFVAAFLIGIALPAWWLAYLALLARPVGANGAMTLEWYPAGRLVLWATFIGATVIVISFMLNFGTDKETFQAGLRRFTAELIRIQAAHDPAAAARLNSNELIAALATVMPRAAVMFVTLLNGFNLWLAGRIVRISGRLQRPWQDISTLVLPAMTPFLLAAAIAGAFLPDIFGIIAGIVAAALFMAYAILGFAVLHAITRNIIGRPFILASTYAIAVLSAGLAVLVMAVLGFAESIFNIRARFNATSGPPSIST